MKTFRKILIASAIFLIVESCNNSSDTKTPATSSETSRTSQTGDEDGPPFKEECRASFNRIGEYKISNDNCNIYYAGQGWNPEFYSCSWTWGEIANNESSEDTNVTFLKIHLLDLNNFLLPKDGTDYGNDSIKKYVIAVYSRDSQDGNYKCVFDPFKTGKYPKPKQWRE